jgi:hypothetical protein
MLKSVEYLRWIWVGSQNPSLLTKSLISTDILDFIYACLGNRSCGCITKTKIKGSHRSSKTSIGPTNHKYLRGTRAPPFTTVILKRKSDALEKYLRELKRTEDPNSLWECAESFRRGKESSTLLAKLGLKGVLFSSSGTGIENSRLHLFPGFKDGTTADSI